MPPFETSNMMLPQQKPQSVHPGLSPKHLNPVSSRIAVSAVSVAKRLQFSRRSQVMCSKSEVESGCKVRARNMRRNLEPFPCIPLERL